MIKVEYDLYVKHSYKDLSLRDWAGSVLTWCLILPLICVCSKHTSNRGKLGDWLWVIGRIARACERGAVGFGQSERKVTVAPATAPGRKTLRQRSPRSHFEVLQLGNKDKTRRGHLYTFPLPEVVRDQSRKSGKTFWKVCTFQLPF